MKKAFDPLEEDSDLQNFMHKANAEASIGSPNKNHSQTISTVTIWFLYFRVHQELGRKSKFCKFNSKHAQLWGRWKSDA